jgi:hypothetical protein
MEEDLGIVDPSAPTQQTVPEEGPTVEPDQILDLEPISGQTQEKKSPVVKLNFATQLSETPPSSQNSLAPEKEIMPPPSNLAPSEELPAEINLEYVNALVEKMQKALKKLMIYKNFYERYKIQYESSLEKVSGICEQYMRQLNSQEGIKTFTIPCGVQFKMKKKTDKLEFTDYDAALVYAKANCPDILKTELLITKAKERLKATGECIPGTEEKKYTELIFSLNIEN